MKLKFIQAINISFLCSFPVATLIASCILDLFVAVFNLSVYFFVSTNDNGSMDLIFENSSLNLWDNYIKSLPDVYLAFGYKGNEISRPIGIKINIGTNPSVDTCEELQTKNMYY